MKAFCGQEGQTPTVTFTPQIPIPLPLSSDPSQGPRAPACESGHLKQALRSDLVI